MSDFKEINKFNSDINKLIDKYTPTNGCENCWGDLHQGCTEKCRNEFKLAREFYDDIVNLITKVANGYDSENANCAIFVVSGSLPVEAVVKAVNDEPELPGEMPDEIYRAVKNDKDALTELVRITVRETKKGILGRLWQ